MRQRETFLYNLRSEGDHYIITKHDKDMEVVSSYHLRGTSAVAPEASYSQPDGNGMTCDCPQGHKGTCRHRKMFPMMLERVDTGWMFDFDNTGQWFDPFGAETPRDLDEVETLIRETPNMPAQEVANRVAEAQPEAPLRRRF